MKIETETLREKCPNTEFFLVHIFPPSGQIRSDTEYLFVFSLNARKHAPEKTCSETYSLQQTKSKAAVHLFSEKSKPLAIKVTLIYLQKVAP